MDKVYSNNLIPKKSIKNYKLTEEDKEHNSIISKRGIYIEHVNRSIQYFFNFIFKIEN